MSIIKFKKSTWLCGSSVRPFVRSHLWYFLSPLDGASVREAHCEQASTAVREAHCEQASTAVRRTEAPCAQASTAVRFRLLLRV